MDLERGSTLRRLHSLSGLFPVGAFLAFHLYVNAWALRGPDAYDAAARRLQQLPLAGVGEIVLVFLPLAFHGVVGLFLIATVSAAAEHATPSGRRLALFQRVTGILLFPFILFHLWTARLVQLSDHESLDLFRLMQGALASPWIRAAYAIGILAATGHLAAGLWSIPRTWELSLGRAARRVWLLVSAAVFMGLSALGLLSLFAFRL